MTKQPRCLRVRVRHHGQWRLCTRKLRSCPHAACESQQRSQRPVTRPGHIVTIQKGWGKPISSGENALFFFESTFIDQNNLNPKRQTADPPWGSPKLDLFGLGENLNVRLQRKLTPVLVLVFVLAVYRASTPEERPKYRKYPSPIIRYLARGLLLVA
jgi:hypothetical protein